MAMLRRTRGRPDDELLRQALRNWAFVIPRPDARTGPTEVRLALDWVARASRPLGDLLDPVVMRGVLRALRLKRDGTVAAAETQRRKRTTLVNSVRYAIEPGRLRADPLAHVSWRITETAQQVDPRVVVNPAQARSLLCAVSYIGGYERARAKAGRPLRRDVLRGTAAGRSRGRHAARLRPARDRVGHRGPARPPPLRRQEVNRQRTDHDLRGLKSRPPSDTRVVPLPPELVRLRRESVDTFGTADGGRLFFNEKGGIVGSSTYDRAWHETRELALPPDLVASPLAVRPYDLRHSALSTWLNAGVDPTEVAERAGNCVEVLMTRYAKCLYGRQALANRRIDALLDEYG
ncbi:site-specific integrase [Streptomyces sp. NPDC085466]|uniref:site-specific integrase n=1 Tax=Streptomyces sp. NPDC085466 TaxID=3365725 RepID=UPI0037CEEEB6